MKQIACQYETRVICNFHFYFSLLQTEFYLIIEEKKPNATLRILLEENES